jgi:hypothetical protein
VARPDLGDAIRICAHGNYLPNEQEIIDGDVIDTVTEKDGRLWSRFGDDSTDLDEYSQLATRPSLSEKEILGRLHSYATRRGRLSAISLIELMDKTYS